ncbi:hypothetical protein DITRI_Ditri14bG0017600 [Diplodiscus trichospermus]
MEFSAATQFHGNNNAEQDAESFSYAMQLVNSTALPMSLHVAIQLGVFEIIAKAGAGAKLLPQEIAAQLPTQNPDAPFMLDSILRLLASHSVLGCPLAVDHEQGDPKRLYSLAPVSKFFVRNEEGVSLGPLVALVQDKIYLDSWCQLKDAIIEGGIPFNRVHGMKPFE